MSDELPIEQLAAGAVAAPSNPTLSAVEQGVIAGVEAAIPAVVAVGAATNPTANAVVTAVTALEPAVANLVQMAQAGLFTPDQLSTAIAQMKANVAGIHNGWLTSAAAHPGS